MRACHCSKTACGKFAVASCAYNYAHRFVWIEDLREEDDPSFYDLCEDHAARLRVMNGWTLDDRRTQVATSQTSLLAN